MGWQEVGTDFPTEGMLECKHVYLNVTPRQEGLSASGKAGKEISAQICFYLLLHPYITGHVSVEDREGKQDASAGTKGNQGT